MKKALKFLDEYFEETLMIILLVVITFSIFLNVFMRYILGTALPWPEELSRYCYVYSGMLSAGYCIKKGSSFRVDLIYEKFPNFLKILVEYFSIIILLLLYAYMAYASIDLIKNTNVLSTAMAIPMKYIYAAIPFGMILGIFRSLQRLYSYTKTLRNGRGDK